MARLNIRLSESKKDQLKKQAEEEGKSMSGAVKEMVEDYIGFTPSGKLPEEDDLANAYQTLWTMSDGGMIEIDTVESKVADQQNTPKTAVRRRIMRPLQRRGYLNLVQMVDAVYYEPMVPLDSRREKRQQKRRDRAERLAEEEMNALDAAELTNDSEAEPVRADGGERADSTGEADQ